MKTYRAAVIGLGFIGPMHLDALRRVPQAEVTALCDTDPRAVLPLAERFHAKAYTDWRDAVKDPEVDVIHNCLPPALHDEVNREAIENGKHIYCEKPLSLTAQNARMIALLAQERGVRMSGEVRKAHGRAGGERRALAAADGVDAGFVLEEQLGAVRRIEPHRARGLVDLRVADAPEVERGLERGGVEQAAAGVDELAARRAEAEEEERRIGGGHGAQYSRPGASPPARPFQGRRI